MKLAQTTIDDATDEQLDRIIELVTVKHFKNRDQVEDILEWVDGDLKYFTADKLIAWLERRDDAKDYPQRSQL